VGARGPVRARDPRCCRRRHAVSLDFLDSPAWALPEPLPITYRELAEEHGIPPHLLQGIQEAMGFAAPDPDDPVPPDDTVLAELARIVLDLGASDESVRRLFRLYADKRPAPRVGGGRPVHGGTGEAMGRLRGGRVGADAPRRRGRPSDGRAGRANDPGALRAPAAAYLDRVRRQEGRDGARTSEAPGAGGVDAGDLLRGHDGVHPAHRGAGGRRGLGWQRRSRRS